MNVDDAKNEFLKRIELSVGDLSALTPATGSDLMLAFYQEVRADGCSLEEDGDMLLYQWGVHDWGRGEYFHWNLTRQLMISDLEDDNIKQLSLTFLFRPTDALRAIDEGNQWCLNPNELTTFQDFIAQSPAFNAVSKLTATKVELQYEGV